MELLKLVGFDRKEDTRAGEFSKGMKHRLTFVLGKSMIGILFTIFGSMALIFIAGFGNINIPHFLRSQDKKRIRINSSKK